MNIKVYDVVLFQCCILFMRINVTSMYVCVNFRGLLGIEMGTVASELGLMNSNVLLSLMVSFGILRTYYCDVQYTVMQFNVH